MSKIVGKNDGKSLHQCCITHCPDSMKQLYRFVGSSVVCFFRDFFRSYHISPYAKLYTLKCRQRLVRQRCLQKAAHRTENEMRHVLHSSITDLKYVVYGAIWGFRWNFGVLPYPPERMTAMKIAHTAVHLWHEDPVEIEQIVWVPQYNVCHAIVRRKSWRGINDRANNMHAQNLNRSSFTGAKTRFPPNRIGQLRFYVTRKELCILLTRIAHLISDLIPNNMWLATELVYIWYRSTHDFCAPHRPERGRRFRAVAPD